MRCSCPDSWLCVAGARFIEFRGLFLLRPSSNSLVSRSDLSLMPHLAPYRYSVSYSRNCEVADDVTMHFSVSIENLAQPKK